MKKESNEVNIEEWYKTNKCLNQARLFVLCTKQTPQKPVENKCKNLFDNWYKCIMLDNIKKIS